MDRLEDRTSSASLALSILQLADDCSEAGTLEYDRASVDFWAKDYGGAAVVQVTI